MTSQDQEYTLRKNERALKYELLIDATVAGHASYKRVGDTLVLPHTVVEPEFRGRGLSKPLIQYALDDARAQGLKVEPLCSAVRDFIDHNPEYRDLTV